jgi:hypothetical protein
MVGVFVGVDVFVGVGVKVGGGPYPGLYASLSLAIAANTVLG